MYVVVVISQSTAFSASADIGIGVSVSIILAVVGLVLSPSCRFYVVGFLLFMVCSPKEKKKNA